MTEKQIAFVRRVTDMDDDSFEYYALSERVSHDVFTRLSRAGGVRNIGAGEEYGSRGASIWSFNPEKCIPILQAAGYTVLNADKILADIKIQRLQADAAIKLYGFVEKNPVACPECGKPSEIGQWSHAYAIAHCYIHGYTVIYNAEGQVAAQDFDKNRGGTLWYDEIVLQLEDPAGYAAKKAAKKEREQRDEDFRILMSTPGEHPPRWTEFPEGEVLEDFEFMPNIYGGGVWYVIQPDAIWIVRNNGGDGDDWSRNNIQTGGAGAIGRRIARTSELEALVRVRAKEVTEK